MVLALVDMVGIGILQNLLPGKGEKMGQMMSNDLIILLIASKKCENLYELKPRALEVSQ